jgi:argonaute-like protein implicated in RNA metabolism and viral defense
MRSSIAQVFTHTGEGLVLKGSRAVIDIDTGSPHLTEAGAQQLITDVLKEYENQMHQIPRRLVVHKTSRYKPEELSGFEKASQRIQLKDFVTIETRGIRFMRKKGIYPPLRGTVVQIGANDYVVYTRGYSHYLDTYPGLRVPTPLEIIEHHGDSSIETICQEIFSLTKMNWNSADFCIRNPITLDYASEVGRILAYVPEEVIPRPEYRFYM